MNNYNLSKVWLAFLIILFFILTCEKQEPEVARIYGSAITVEEFTDLVRFNPSFSQLDNERLLKRKWLTTLIAVKLFTIDNRHMSNNDRQQLLLEQLHREAKIEALWREEIFNKINISEYELKDAYFKSKELRIVKYLLYPDELSALSDYDKLSNGLTFDQLAQNKGFDPGEIPVDTIRWENKLPHLETAVFKMTENQISKPIKEGKYYFILELKNVLREIFTAEDEYNRQKPRLVKQTRGRKAILAFENRFSEFMRENYYHLDKDIFKEMVKNIDHELYDEKGLHKDSLDFWNLQNSRAIYTSQELPIVNFSDGDHWDIKTLIERIAVSPYQVQLDNGKGAFRTSMIGVTRQVLDDELLSRFADELGLQRDDQVQQDAKMWQEYFVYSANMAEYLKTYGSENLEEELIRRLDRSNAEINFALLDTLEIENSNMVALKRHFPGRTITPIIKQLPPMPRFEEAVLSGRK